LLADENENRMLMLINCWILDYVCSFFLNKTVADLSKFALKSEHIRFLQNFIVWPKCLETETFMSPCPNYVTKWIFTGEMYPRFTMILSESIVNPAVFEHNSVKYSPFSTNSTSTPWSGIGVKLEYVVWALVYWKLNTGTPIKCNHAKRK